MPFDPSDSSKLLRWSVSIKESSEKASKSWVDFRGKRQHGMFLTFVDEIKNICTYAWLIARTIDMDPVPFKAAEGDVESFQLSAMGGPSSIKSYSPSAMGKVSLSLYDVRTASKELVEDARELRDASGYDFMALGADLGIIFGSLVRVAKVLGINTKGLIKARNTILAHFKVVTDRIMSEVPEGGPANEVPAESIVFASWAKRASIEARRDPSKAIAMLDGLLHATENRSWRS